MSKKEILEKIKDVKKIPKWKFAFKRSFVWASLVIAILLGAFAVSMIIHQILAVDWDVIPKIPQGPVFGFFKVFPYFWALVSVFLFVFVYFDFRHTRKGYRYSGGIVIGLSFVVAILLGVGTYLIKAPHCADDFFHQFPGYEMMHYDAGKMWLAPEKGLLGGVILEIKGNKVIILEDFGSKIWDVNIENAHIGKNVLIEMHEKIKMIGEMLYDGEFEAHEIRPFNKFGF